MWMCTAAVLVAASLFADRAEGARRVVDQQDAQRLGLTRAWFAQVRVDPAQHRVESAVLNNDRLTVLTTAGVVHELNALTGETVWVAPIGNADYPSLGPTANDQFVALVNGSTLYVLDRNDGKPILVRRVGGAPGAAPAVARSYVFVPLVAGRIEGYPLNERKLTPWYYQSHGRTMVAPLATGDSIVWSTDTGNMYVGNSNDLRVRFRLETRSPIVAPPGYHQPYVYAATTSGELFAMHEITGVRRWKYATGFPVTRTPAVLEQRVFVTSDEPSLHCVDENTGSIVWESPGVVQFAAASKTRVYGVDDFGALVLLDAATGAVIARTRSDNSISALVNDQTDRIYLVSDSGLVQCLHELGSKQPLRHNPPPAKDEKPAATAPAAAATAPPAATEAEPAADAAAPPAEEPAMEEEPAETPPAADDNPFEDVE
jgi:outer membrane protein assembly factor BamB